MFVLVTGCTDGIGKAYTAQLVKAGLKKFVLVGRNPEKLGQVEQMMKAAKPNLEIERVLFDFQKDDGDKLAQQLYKYDIGFCLHSVGVAPKTMCNTFENIQLSREIVQVNATGSLDLLNAVVPRMMASGGGHITLVSSSMAYGPAPFILTYPESKCFVNYLGRRINYEYNKSGVNVQVLTPALVATKLSQYDAAEGPFIVTPDDFVKEAINTVGVVNETSGCFNHDLQLLMRHAFPWFVVYRIMLFVFSHHRVRMERNEEERNR